MLVRNWLETCMTMTSDRKLQKWFLHVLILQADGCFTFQMQKPAVESAIPKTLSQHWFLSASNSSVYIHASVNYIHARVHAGVRTYFVLLQPLKHVISYPLRNWLRFVILKPQTFFLLCCFLWPFSSELWDSIHADYVDNLCSFR